MTKTCTYALRASVYLAAKSQGDYVSVKRVSKELDISYHFLVKILQQLSHGGLVESKKGPTGGVRLGRMADQINIVEIIEVIDGKDLFTECALRLPECGTAKPCPLHEQWADTRDEIYHILDTTTLDDLVQKGREDKLRITDDGHFNWA